MNLVIDDEIRMLIFQAVYSLYLSEEAQLQKDVRDALWDAIKIMASYDDDTKEEDDSSPQSIIDSHYAKLQKSRQKQLKVDLARRLCSFARDEQEELEYCADLENVPIFAEMLHFLREVWSERNRFLAMVESKLRNGWKLEKLPMAVLSIFLIGIGEIHRFGNVGAVIMGCIELGKAVGHKEEKSFINAILDSIGNDIKAESCM